MPETLTQVWYWHQGAPRPYDPPAPQAIDHHQLALVLGSDQRGDPAWPAYEIDRHAHGGSTPAIACKCSGLQIVQDRAALLRVLVLGDEALGAEPVKLP